MLPDIDIVTPDNHTLEGCLITRTTGYFVWDGLVPLPPGAVLCIWFYHFVDGGNLKTLLRSWRMDPLLSTANSVLWP